MTTADDIKRMVKDGENRHLEIKRCSDKLPKDIWETYSAFANTRGDIILLRITEHKDRKGSDRFEFTGVTDTNSKGKEEGKMGLTKIKTSTILN